MDSKTLVIAPHADDEALSCGGLIYKRVLEGADVKVVIVCARAYDYGRKIGAFEEHDSLKAQKILGYKSQHNLRLQEGEPQIHSYYSVLEPLERILRDFDPTEVVIPGANDLNQDHRFMHEVSRIALRSCNRGRVKRILAFRAFDALAVTLPTYYVSMWVAQMECKLQSIAAYTQESRTLPHPRAPENIQAQARVWGSHCGSEFAEAYDLIYQAE